MVLPIPNLLQVANDIDSSEYVQRGNSKFDLLTKSEMTNTIAFCRRDQCGRFAYIDFRKALTLNAISDDCQIVPVARLSIQGYFPRLYIPGRVSNQAENRSVLQRMVSDISLNSIGGNISNAANNCS